MNPAPSLRELQRWLKWALTDPRGVAEALSDPAPQVDLYRERYTSPTASYFDFIIDDDGRAVERMDVYAEGYFSRILECLESDFPKTKAAIGSNYFTKIAADYLKAHPSKFTSIEEVGWQFADFISHYHEIDLPENLADIALLEWNLTESFYAQEFVVDPNWRHQIAMHPTSSLMIHPAVRLLQSAWPKSGSCILIYRFEDEVLWTETEPAAFQLLSRLQAGVPLVQALDEVHGLTPEAVAANFGFWVEKDILCGIATINSEANL